MGLDFCLSLSVLCKYYGLHFSREVVALRLQEAYLEQSNREDRDDTNDGTKLTSSSDACQTPRADSGLYILGGPMLQLDTLG